MSVEWHLKEFKEDLISSLVSNGDIVAKFVETEAKKNIMAIQQPDWGAGYRKYVSMTIRSEVEKTANYVEIRVGVPPGRTTKSGRQTKHIGFYIEMGSAKFPAHPYLRPAVFGNASKIIALL